MQRSSATPKNQDVARKIVACCSAFLFWHGTIPTSYFIFLHFFPYHNHSKLASLEQCIYTNAGRGRTTAHVQIRTHPQYVHNSCLKPSGPFQSRPDGFKAVRAKICPSRYKTVEPVSKPSGPLRSRPARFKSVGRF